MRKRNKSPLLYGSNGGRLECMRETTFKIILCFRAERKRNVALDQKRSKI
jgi:hypothetical protein